MAVAGGTALCSLLLGLALGASANRSVTLGLDLVGCFLLVAGFFTGNRGPVRSTREATPLIGPRFMRWATRSELEDAINSSALFVVLGLGLIVLGIAADTRYSLF